MGEGVEKSNLSAKDRSCVADAVAVFKETIKDNNSLIGNTTTTTTDTGAANLATNLATLKFTQCEAPLSPLATGGVVDLQRGK